MYYKSRKFSEEIHFQKELSNLQKKDKEDIDNEFNDQDDEIKNVNFTNDSKKEIKELKKRLEKANSKIREVKQESASIKLKNKEISLKLYQTNKLLKEEQQKNKSLKEIIDLQNKKLEQIEHLNKHIEFLEKQLKNQKIQIQKLKSGIIIEKKTNKNLKSKIKKLKNTDTHKIITNLQDTVTKKDATINKLKRKISSLSSSSKIVQNTKEKKDTFLSQPIDEQVKSVEYLLGTICEENGIFLFKELEGNKYCLDNQETSYENGVPVQVEVIDSNTVKVVKIYSYELFNKNYVYLKTPTRTKEEKQQYSEDLKDINVLVIGSKFKNLYLEEMKKYKIKAEWFNPFEQNVNILNNLINKSDIVIVCTGHVSHSVIDHLDVNDIKNQLLYPDSKEKLIARIRYTAEMLGIRKNQQL